MPTSRMANLLNRLKDTFILAVAVSGSFYLGYNHNKCSDKSNESSNKDKEPIEYVENIEGMPITESNEPIEYEKHSDKANDFDNYIEDVGMKELPFKSRVIYLPAIPYPPSWRKFPKPCPEEKPEYIRLMEELENLKNNR